MEPTLSSETSAFKLQTPGKFPKEHRLITPQFMSEKRVRCLRTYIHPTAFCNHVFENVYYVPIERQMFRDIRIKIADPSGNPIAFKDSMTTAKVVLNFRRAVFLHRI